MRSVSPTVELPKGTLKRKPSEVNIDNNRLSSDVSNRNFLNSNDYPSIKIAKLGDGGNDNVFDSENLLVSKNENLVVDGNYNSPLTEANLRVHDSLQESNLHGSHPVQSELFLNENNPNRSNPTQSKFSPKKLRIDEVKD